MPQYRLYSLDREHKVNSSSDGDFRSDDEAMAHAYELATICPGVEVWCGRRMVARVPNLGSNSNRLLPLRSHDAP